MDNINDEGRLLLIEAMAHDAAEEYREYKTVLKNRALNKNERAYFELRANESLKFFKSNIFNLAFPNVGEYIIEQLEKEKI